MAQLSIIGNAYIINSYKSTTKTLMFKVFEKDQLISPVSTSESLPNAN